MTQNLKLKMNRTLKQSKLPDNLEDQIDLPIKNCVAMLNLLGIETWWACCGFDYKDQPKWKDHVYGNPHIIFSLENGLNMKHNGLLYLSQTTGWCLSVCNASCQVAFTLTAKQMYPQIWQNKKSIHFHENGNIAITNLETQLKKFKDHFKDEVR